MGIRTCVPLALAGAAVALAVPAAASPSAHPVLRHGPIGHHHVLPRGAHETSDNWAGYVAEGADHAFTSVESHWTQPTVDCSSNGDASFWVGLDGYDSDSVEQTGADGVCDGNRPSYYAWWEMYPADTQEIDKPVDGGDKFSSKVTYDGDGKYTMYLKNETKGWTDTEHAHGDDTKDNSAEVIFEGVGPQSDAIPKFDDVAMSGNTVNGKALNSFDPRKIDLARNGNTLVTTGGFDGSGDFGFAWKAGR